MSGWYSQGWGRGHSVENCVTHWFTGSHNRSFLSHRHTLIYIYTHTRTHTMQSPQIPQKVQTFLSCLNPVKKHINNFFFCLQSLFKRLLYNMCPLHDTTLLMTISSCLCPRSNLELRRRESALVFWTRPGPQTANGLLCDIIITRPLA